MTTIPAFFGTYILFAFWQSTLWLAAALVGGRLYRRMPWKAHCLYILGIAAATLTPLLAAIISLTGGGLLPVSPPQWNEPATPGLLCLAGTALFAAALLYGIASSRKLMFCATPFPDKESQDALLRHSKTLRNVSLPILFTSPSVKSPTVWCWGLHPAVLLPESLANQLRDAERDAVFLHELSHIVRRDHLTALFARLCGAVLFWNPLYWLVLWQSDLAADESCDLVVLAQGNIAPTQYTDTLLRLVVGVPAKLSAFNFLSRKEKIMKRIEQIQSPIHQSGNRKIANQPLWTASVFLTALLVSITLAFCQGKPISPEKAAMMGYVEDFFAHNFRDITMRKSLEWGEVKTDDKGNRTIRYKYEGLVWDKEKMVFCNDFTFDKEGNYVDAKKVEGFPKPIGKAEVKPEEVKSYAVNKRIADFPENPGFDTPENAYASQKYKIAATITDKDFQKTYKEKFVVQKVLLMGDRAFVIGYREYDKLWDSDMLIKRGKEWKHQGNLQSGTQEGLMQEIENNGFPKQAAQAVETTETNTDGGFMTGGSPGVSGFTHLVFFSPKGDFNPSTPEHFLNVFREKLLREGPKTGYFRTKPVEGKLLGSLCTGDPAGLERVIKSVPELEFVRSERLTKESFEAYEKTAQESLPSPRLLEIEKSDWFGKLDERQKKYVQWDENQFARAYEQKNYDVGADREEFEKQWAAELEKPEPGYPGSELVPYDIAIIGLATIKSDKALKPLVKIAAERVAKDNAHRHYATKALGMLGDPAAVPELIPLVYHFNFNTRWEAQVSLVRLTGQNFGGDAKAWGEWYNANRDKLGKDLPEFDSSPVDWSCGSGNAEIKMYCDPKVQEASDLLWFNRQR